MSWARWSTRSTRRPALAAAVVFIAGIVFHPLLPHAAWIWIVCAAAAAGAGVALRSRWHESAGATAMAMFFAGIAAAQLAAFYFPINDISRYATDHPRLARLELKIDQPLRVLSGAFSSGGRPMPPRQVTTASVVRVLTTSGWVDASGRILVQLDPPNESLAIGQTVRALGMLQRPGVAMNPGQFDWAEYYRDQRILTSIQLNHGGALEILKSASPSPVARLREGVRAALARGFTTRQSLDHALLRALVLGDNDPELRDVQEQFRRTGTSHHLAISGMHVAVLGYVVYLVCHLMMLHPRRVAICAIAAVILYGVVALPSPPVLRSVILCSSIALGVLARRSNDMIQLLAVSVLALLACQPLDLYNAGFQLSFGTVLGLMTLAPRVLPWLVNDPDARVALQAGGNPPRRLVLMYRLRYWFAVPVTTAIVAWLVSMPLIAYHFDQLNPWAVVASLLLAIPVFLALIAGFLKIVLTLLLPFAAPAWASIAAVPVSWMRRGVDWLSLLPGSDVPLPANSILFIVVYYALLLLPLVPMTMPKVRFSFRLAPAAAVMLLVLIPLTGGASGVPDGALRVTTLAIGAGQCCVIELPDGRVILLDAGSVTLQEPVRKCITPYLRSRGHSSIDEIWLADCDYDHIGAAAELIRSYRVGRVVMSSAFERDALGKPAGEVLLETIRQRRVAVTRLSRGDRVELGKSVSVDVLWPPRGGVDGASNNSDLVLKLTYARRTILFPADIQQPAQAALLTEPSALRCDAMLAPHHGSGESATAAFIAAADPLYIVSSNDRTLSQKQRIFARQVGQRKLFRTNECGATTITIDRNGGLIVAPFIASDIAR